MTTERDVESGEHLSITAKDGYRGLSGQVLVVEEDGFWVLTPEDEVVRVDDDGISGIEGQGMSRLPQTLVRTYKGAQQADATSAFQREADVLANAGYEPTTQSWAAGQWGVGAFLVALLLLFVLLGILIFLYLLIVKPEGTLTVTYTRRETARSPSNQAISSGSTLADRLSQLGAARDAGLITDEEYEAKRRAVMDGA